jgi:hypothetical protein
MEHHCDKCSRTSRYCRCDRRPARKALNNESKPVENGKRPHTDTFVKRIAKITAAAINDSLAEIDRELEAFIGAHQPASEGSAWLLEWATEPMWLAAHQAPIKTWWPTAPITERIAPVKDANLAIRFSREIDALNMARLLGVEGFYVPREHEFVPARTGSENPHG